MWLEYSDDLLREHAYLVARGVRPLALIGQCEANTTAMLSIANRLEVLAAPDAIPFVIDRGDGIADYGYAAAGWTLDLLHWLIRAGENAVPAKHRHRILALLLGYRAEAVQHFEEQNSGRFFAAFTASPARAAM